MPWNAADLSLSSKNEIKDASDLVEAVHTLSLDPTDEADGMAEHVLTAGQCMLTRRVQISQPLSTVRNGPPRISLATRCL